MDVTHTKNQKYVVTQTFKIYKRQPCIFELLDSLVTILRYLSTKKQE